jgi:hypothetical protein
MLKDLVKLANHLDAKGLRKEADYLDKVITKLSEGMNPYQSLPGPTWVDGVRPTTNPYQSLPGSTWVDNVSSPLSAEIGERAGRSALRGAGGKMVAKKLLGKVLVPLGVAMDIVAIGEATYEGVNAFMEVSEAKQKVSRNIVKSAIGDALTSALGELERDGWHKEGKQSLAEMKRALLQWRRGASLDAGMKEAFRTLISIATQIKAWGRYPVDTYIGTASTGPYSEHLDVDATRELYRHLIGNLTLA